MDIEQFNTSKRPYIFYTPQSISDFENGLTKIRLEGDAILVARFRGRKMQNWLAFYNEIGAVLQFPSYFGENLDALYDCLTDLGWFSFKSIVFAFTDSELILSECSEDNRRSFGKLLKDVCDYWITPCDEDQEWGHTVVPFHVILQGQDKNLINLGELYA